MQVCLTKSSDSSFISEEESVVEVTKKEEKPKIKIVEDEEVKKENFEEVSMIRRLNFSTSQDSITDSSKTTVVRGAVPTVELSFPFLAEVPEPSHDTLLSYSPRSTLSKGYMDNSSLMSQFNPDEALSSIEEVEFLQGVAQGFKKQSTASFDFSIPLDKFNCRYIISA